MSTDSLEEKALELIKSRPEGVLQSELWKDLDIDSRKCSRIIARLEEEGKIKRTWETVKGTRTYRISYLPQKAEAPKREISFDVIMAGEAVAPCIGCTYECEPDYCPDLGNWIELLSRSPSVTSSEVHYRKSSETAASGVKPQAKEAPAKSSKSEKAAAEAKGAREVKAVKEAGRTKSSRSSKK